MASEPPNIYALIELEELKKAALSSVGFCPVIRLRLFDLAGLECVLRYAFLEMPEKTLSLCLETGPPADEKDNEHWYNILAILLAHPGFSKTGGDRILVFFLAEDLAFEYERFRSALFSALRKHGFRYLKMLVLSGAHCLLDSDDGIFFVSKTMLENRSALLQSYHEYFINSTVRPSLLIAYEPGAIQWLADLRGEAEQALLQSNPILFKIAAERHQITLQLRKMRCEKVLIQEDLESKNAYLDFLLAKSKEMNESGEFEFNDLVKLKKFYYYEYEILPLWYKRFGHIIKVIMGKRRLSSLFNDDIPKYRP